MGIFLKIFALIMGMIMAFFSSGTPKQSYDPETVDINGVTYKNCFIPEYAGIICQNDDDSTRQYFDYNETFYIEKSGLFGSETRWYEITDKILLRGYSLYPLFGPSGKIYYCKESDWDELKSFYYNLDNWTFHASITHLLNDEDSLESIEINREYIDSELWLELMQFAYDCDEHENELQKQGLYYEIPMENHDKIKDYYFFKMESSDDLFLAGTKQIMDYDGTLYMVVVTVGDMYYGAYRIPNELQNYIRVLDDKILLE